MTIVSKIKTLIEYARFGMNMGELFKGNNSELFIPKSMQSMNFNQPVGHQYTVVGKKIIALKGRVKSIAGIAFAESVLELIDLPECTAITSWGMFGNATNLKEVHFLSMTDVKEGETFLNCTALEFVEFGVLTFMHNSTLKGCTALHTFICGTGTAANLYLHDCPLLTQECLHNIIDNVADRTGTSALTLQIGEDNIAKISDDYKNKLINKNWNLA